LEAVLDANLISGLGRGVTRVFLLDFTDFFILLDYRVSRFRRRCARINVWRRISGARQFPVVADLNAKEIA
jgi:hypothetical protein